MTHLFPWPAAVETTTKRSRNTTTARIFTATLEIRPESSPKANQDEGAQFGAARSTNSEFGISIPNSEFGGQSLVLIRAGAVIQPGRSRNETQPGRPQWQRF